MTSPIHILIVEDDESVAELLKYNLGIEGFRVSCSSSGEEAEIILLKQVPDLVLLDWTLPGISGIELCRRIRARPDTQALPIILLTARSEEGERVFGLAAGADDYVIKPFSIYELIARIRSLLRRAIPTRRPDTLEVGELVLDRTSYRVRRANRQIHLGPTEYKLLVFLMERPGQVYTRTQIVEFIWGTHSNIDERTVDVHVGRLRKAINNPRERDPIRTVRGTGYSFDENFSRLKASQ